MLPDPCPNSNNCGPTIHNAHAPLMHPSPPTHWLTWMSE
jgi:hypothetical protein